MEIYEIDWEDKSGLVALREWDKRKETKKKIAKDINKITELEARDWIQIFLYANDSKLIKTPLFKEMFLFSERTGLVDSATFGWRAFNYGPYSDKIEAELRDLEREKIIEVERKMSRSKRIFFPYMLKKKEEAAKLWDMLPTSIRDVVKGIAEEFKGRDVDEIEKFIYDAYPKFAVATA